MPITLADLPRNVPGFEQVEWLIIDDGSTDKTVQVAQAPGADYLHGRNLQFFANTPGSMWHWFRKVLLILLQIALK